MVRQLTAVVYINEKDLKLFSFLYFQRERITIKHQKKIMLVKPYFISITLCHNPFFFLFFFLTIISLYEFEELEIIL